MNLHDYQKYLTSWQIEIIKAIYQNDKVQYIDLGGLSAMDMNFSINQDGIFPLYLACVKGRYHIYQIFLKLLISSIGMVNVLLNSFGVSKTKKDSQGQTVIFPAVYYNHIDILKLLHKHGLYAESDKKGTTPLHVSCKKDHTQISLYLVDSMFCSPNATKTSGLTPYHYACQNGNILLMKYLERKGADPYIVTRSGITSLHLACKSGKLEAVAYLCEKHNVDANAQSSKSKSTALQYACKEGHVKVTQYLLENMKANPNLLNSNYDDALTLAIQSQSQELVNYLLKICKFDFEKINIRNTLTYFSYAVLKNLFDIASSIRDTAIELKQPINLNPQIPGKKSYEILTLLEFCVKQGFRNQANYLISQCGIQPKGEVQSLLSQVTFKVKPTLSSRNRTIQHQNTFAFSNRKVLQRKESLFEHAYDNEANRESADMSDRSVSPFINLRDVQIVDGLAQRNDSSNNMNYITIQNQYNLTTGISPMRARIRKDTSTRLNQYQFTTNEELEVVVEKSPFQQMQRDDSKLTFNGAHSIIEDDSTNDTTSRSYHRNEILNKRIESMDKKPWEQEGRDEQGRKHFYGAFTGALRESSVGFKGTVGSKEGFAPKQFVSSRQEKAEAQKKQSQQQSIFEFMDEDDIVRNIIANMQSNYEQGEHLAGSTIQAQTQFDTLSTKEREILKQNMGAQNSVLGHIADQLIVTSNDSKGFQLLRAMGYKERGLSRNMFKSYESSDDESIDGDYEEEMIRQHQQISGISETGKTTNKKREIKDLSKKHYDGPIMFKSNLYGLGYQLTAQDQENVDRKEQQKEIASKRIKMSEFNFDGMEEDDDDMMPNTQVYQDFENKDNYVKELDIINFKQPFQKGDNTKDKKEEQANQFVFADTLQIKPVGGDKIKVPKDFNPLKNQQQIKQSLAQQTQKRNLIDEIYNEQSQKFKKSFGSSQQSHMNAEKRSKILGEESYQKAEQSHHHNENTKASTNNNKFISQSKPAMISNEPQIFIDLPFKDDHKKVLRFKAYVLEIEGQIVTFDVPNNMMKGSQISAEKEEFEKLLKVNKYVSINQQQKSQYQQSVYTSEMKNKKQEDIQQEIEKLEKEMNKRTELNWQPDNLLLARFGFKDPHENKTVKPPKFFKNEHQNKSETVFEKKETMQSMGGSTMAFDDGNTFFKDVQLQFQEKQGVETVEDVEKKLLEQEAIKADEIKEKQKENYQRTAPKDLLSLKDRPPMSLFESIFNDNKDDDCDEDV